MEFDDKRIKEAFDYVARLEREARYFKESGLLDILAEKKEEMILETIKRVNELNGGPMSEGKVI